MNYLNQIAKITALSLLMAILLSSCSKEEVLVHSKEICDNLSLKITNNLDETISDLFVEGIEIGELEKGDSISNVCLELITSDSGVFPYLNFIGTYLGEQTGQYMIICGTGLQVIKSGNFEISLTSISDNIIYYEIL